MNIGDVLYNLTIYPFEFLIEIIYFIFRRNDMGVRIILIGIVVNIIAIPLYSIADKWQKRELDLQAHFKPKIDEIKAVFSGDKRQMLIQSYYRINNYHPIYSLRGLLGLLIQVPIFIAAYHFISNLENLDNSFGFINSLYRPDGLIKISNITINLLPILMTVFNILASLIHTRDLTNKERIPLFIMAGLFLVLLYNSPSALLVYWTTTNLFSLIKNIVLLFINKIKKIIKYILIIFITILVLLFILLNSKIIASKADTLTIVNSIVYVVMFISFIRILPYDKIITVQNKEYFLVFVFSSLLFTILLGLFIPISLIASSPLEFDKHFYLIFNTFTQIFSTLFLYPLLFYFLFQDKTKKRIILFFTFISVYALFNTFLFKGNYGIINGDFLFNDASVLIPSNKENIVNIAVGIIVFISIAIIFKNRKTNVFKNILVISSIALLIISIKDIYVIKNVQTELSKIYKKDKKENKDNTNIEKKQKIINMSKDEKNVFVFFMDMVIPYYIPFILERMPDMNNDLDGFTLYKETLAFSTFTRPSLFSLLGGYDYTPLKINKRSNETMAQKINEAHLLLPRIFIKNGYEATVVSPQLVNWSSFNAGVFEKYNIRAYEKSYNIKEDTSYSSKTEKDTDIYLTKFSLFRQAPMIIRSHIYNDGNWASAKRRASLNSSFEEYIYLKELTNSINIVSNKSTYTFFGNSMTHEPVHFNSDFLPSIELKKADDKDINEFSGNYYAKSFYANARFLIEITNFIKYLKDNNIYDNTKIIIVSDHSFHIPKKSIFNFEEEIFLDSLKEINRLNSFLMVKDFSSRGKLEISSNFMTTADTAIIATKHLKNIINPYTGLDLKDDKKNGIYVVTPIYNLLEKNNNIINIQSMFYVKPSIFNTNNWKEIPKEKWQEIIDNK